VWASHNTKARSSSRIMIRCDACWCGCISPASAEFVIQDYDGNAVPRATHDLSRYDQLKRTRAVQRNRPVNEQLDAMSFRQRPIGAKKDASRTKIAGLTCTLVGNPLLPRTDVSHIQFKWVASMRTPFCNGSTHQRRR